MCIVLVFTNGCQNKDALWSLSNQGFTQVIRSSIANILQRHTGLNTDDFNCWSTFNFVLSIAIEFIFNHSQGTRPTKDEHQDKLPCMPDQSASWISRCLSCSKAARSSTLSGHCDHTCLLSCIYNSSSMPKLASVQAQNTFKWVVYDTQWCSSLAKSFTP